MEAIVAEYDDVISPVNAISPTTSTGLNTLEFDMPGAADLYRDLNDGCLMLYIKLTETHGPALGATGKVRPVNLTLRSLFSNASVTLCDREINEKDTV
jgi:hypothetical protein